MLVTLLKVSNAGHFISARAAVAVAAVELDALNWGMQAVTRY